MGNSIYVVKNLGQGELMALSMLMLMRPEIKKACEPADFFGGDGAAILVKDNGKRAIHSYNSRTNPSAKYRRTSVKHNTSEVVEAIEVNKEQFMQLFETGKFSEETQEDKHSDHFMLEHGNTKMLVCVTCARKFIAGDKAVIESGMYQSPEEIRVLLAELLESHGYSPNSAEQVSKVKH